jgi:hypothetical protein
MKIYELTFESFKDSYCGHWSSLEKAMEELPNCQKFLRSMRWELPHWYTDHETGTVYSPNYEANLNIKPTFKRHGNDIMVMAPGFVVDTFHEEQVPEVKEAGKPYVPPTTKRSPIEQQILTNKDWGRIIYVRAIEVDEVEK